MQNGTIPTLKAENYAKRVNAIISGTATHVQRQLANMEYKPSDEQKKQIIEKAKLDCKTAIAEQFTKILHEDAVLEPIYHNVKVVYEAGKFTAQPMNAPTTSGQDRAEAAPIKPDESENIRHLRDFIVYYKTQLAADREVSDLEEALQLPKNSITVQYNKDGTASGSIKYPDGKTDTVKVSKRKEETLEQLEQAPFPQAIKTPVEQLESAFQNLDDQLNYEIDNAANTSIGKTELKQYRKTARNYKATGVALTVLAYMVELGAIGAAVPLFMEHAELNALYQKAIEEIPNFSDYVSYIQNGIGEFHEKFDAHVEALVRQALGMHDASVEPLIKGVLITSIVLALMSATWMIASKSEEAGNTKVQEMMQQNMGVISQETVDKAVSAAQGNQQAPSNTMSEATDFASKLLDKLVGLHQSLLVESSKGQEMTKTPDTAGL
ncbi:MAG: hypothetical protein JSS50_01450 [Proteobacteria bacterium]|nr:hypothetical protein [Pseudomonadota bacterium]